MTSRAPADLADTVVPLTLTECCRALAGLPTGLVRPQRPDPVFMATLPRAPLPRPRTTVRVWRLPQEPRTIPTAVAAEGVLTPAGCAIALASFVVEHPRARFIIDPGVSTDLGGAVWPHLQAPLRWSLRPPRRPRATVESLQAAGIDPDQLDFALPSHLHWDHVCGLLDLPDLPLHVHDAEWDWMTADGPAPAGAVRPSLTGRPITTFTLDGPPVLTLGASHDLFGDSSVLAVDLAGHTPGSVGILLHTPTGWVLIAGDAIWTSHQLTRIRPKASLPGHWVDHDRRETFRTVQRLSIAARHVRVIGSHDHDATLSLPLLVRP